MFNQHAKWLTICNLLSWRAKVASVNPLITSTVWRQDHNGFSHQDPGFIDHVVNKKAGVVRVYLPPDANTLLSVTDHCLRSRNYVNVIVAGKQPAPQWLTMDQAVKHCAAGIGRTGTVAACVLKQLGLGSEQALQQVRDAGSNPQSALQSGWIERF